MQFIFPDQRVEVTEAGLGGKARSLIRLHRMGLRVPPFFVVPAPAFLRHLRKGDGPARFGELLLAISEVDQRRASRSRDLPGAEALEARFPDDGATIEYLKLANAVRTAIENEPLDPALRDALSVALERLGPGPFAVRSSMEGEDSTKHSFAGQLDSYLFQNSIDQVSRSLLRCWSSAFGERSLTYALRAGQDLSGLRMGVVVQQMLDPQVSGVLFTADPSTGRRDQCVLAATWGLGEGLVSGACDADEIRWRERDGEVSVHVGHKDAALARHPTDPGTVKVDVPVVDQGRRCLSPSQVTECCAMGLLIERHFGMPQDIEWAHLDGQFHFLQARPITSLPPMDESAGPHHIWDNSNIQESYSGVTTPLTFSFASKAYRTVYETSARLVGTPESTLREFRTVFQNLLGLSQGRVYYNLGNWYRKLQLAPSFQRNRKDLEDLLGVEDPVNLEDVTPVTLSRFSRLLGMARMVGRTLPLVLRLEHHVTHFRRHFDAVERKVDRESLEALSLSELMGKIELLDHELLDKWQIEIVNIGWLQRRSGDLRRLLDRASGADADGLYAELLSGAVELESVAPTRRLLDLAASAREDMPLADAIRNEPDAAALRWIRTHRLDFAARLEVYIERYGDRVMGELKLETETARHDPGFVIRVLRNYLDRSSGNSGGSPAASAHPNSSDREPVRSQGQGPQAAEHSVAVRMNALARWRFRRALASVRWGVRTREALRFDRARMFGLYRDVYRAIGLRLWEAGRLDEPRDVFYLTTEEIAAYHEGRAVSVELAPIARARKAEWSAYLDKSPPNRFETRGPVGHWEVVSPSPETSSGAAATDELRGIGCYPGIVESEVRILLSPREDLSVNGRILATVRTDPGWAPLFPTVRGLLVERGSSLSHSAIVARELRIPTIVGVRGLTAVLSDGERVRMDGLTGRVERRRTDAAELEPIRENGKAVHG